MESKNRLIDALNRIDKFAGLYVAYSENDKDNRESIQLEKDYNLLSDFIEKNTQK